VSNVQDFSADKIATRLRKHQPNRATRRPAPDSDGQRGSRTVRRFRREQLDFEDQMQLFDDEGNEFDYGDDPQFDEGEDL